MNPSMSISALRGEQDLRAFVDWLADEGGLAGLNQAADATYQTYLGWGSAHPLHLGIVAAERPASAGEMADRFRFWQVASEVGIPRLGPNFGLNRDFDEFLIGGAPVLCATMGALIPELASELLELMQSLRAGLADWAGAPNAIWALHLAAAVADDSAFKAARHHLNAMGGVNESMTLLPQPLYDMSGDETWPEELAENRKLVPIRSVFSERVLASIPPGIEPSAVKAALQFLAENRYTAGPPLELIAALATA